MADVFVKMGGDGDSSAKCREARRRRIEMRRLPSVTGETAPLTANTVGSDMKREPEPYDPVPAEKRRRPEPPLNSSPSSSSGGGVGGSGGKSEVPAVASCPVSGSDPGTDPPLGFGSVALSGRSREMEDAVSVRPFFFRPASGSPMHFFAVFDGHGGSHVSKLCKEQMHVLLAEELTRIPATAEVDWEAVSAAVKRSYGRMDELALSSCACGRVGGRLCGCDRSGFQSEIVGSTAVMAIVGRDRIFVANCGDSRAVLSRGGRTVPVSDDHKPDRPDEMARIEAAGGRVIFLNGARVNGILAMSRALGDKYFKPVVISEPEIRIMDRHPQDECLILASDGLWDVLPNELACDVAKRCLEENLESNEDDFKGGAMERSSSGGGEEQSPQLRCNLAAALLARLALGRKSADNISVIVVDLRREQA